MFGAKRQTATTRHNGGGLFGAFGIRQGKTDHEPVQDDSAACGAMGASERASAHVGAASNPQLPQVSRLVALEPQEHARHLLDWLQGPGGRTGAVTARELAAVYSDMVEQLGIDPISWHKVGREFRALIGDKPRRYVEYRSGKRVERLRTYFVPPAHMEARMKQLAPVPAPPVPPAERWAGPVLVA